MKKILMFVVAVALTSIGMSAAVTWTAMGFDESTMDGTAYLVQIVDPTVTVGTIDAYLKDNGAKASGTAGTKYNVFTNVAEGAGVGIAGYIYEETIVDAYMKGGDTSTFVLIFEENGKISVSTQAYDVTAGEGNILQSPEEVSFVAGNWYDSTPSVPEPTALALLALGVAGVALRRRKMA